MSAPDNRIIDAALARMPEWQPPRGFDRRVAGIAAEGSSRYLHGWAPLVLRGAGIAACVSVAAWLGSELLSGVLSATAGGEGMLAWTLAGGSLLLAWNLVRRQLVSGA